MSRVRLWSLGVLTLLASGLPPACSGGVVGGECRSGLVVCDGRCVDVTSDPEHCGSCQNACEPGTSCVAGTCQLGPDAGMGGAAGSGAVAGFGGMSVDSGMGGAGALDSSAGGPATGGTSGVGGTDASDGGDASTCVPPFNTGARCGDCTTSCGGATPFCAPSDGGFACVSACPPGLELCGDQCVDLDVDPAHCGECFAVCASGFCEGGMCVDAPDGGSGGSGGMPADGGRGGARTDGGSGGAGGVDGGGSGGAADGGGCVPPFDTPSQCGDCFTTCGGATPFCAPVDGGFGCVPACASDLTLCGDQCVDLDVDPAHCGQCFHACPSGLCQAGTCVGARAGHAIVMCMDYAESSRNAPQTQLLGNSVFIAPADPVRVMAYRQYTPNAVVGSVRRTLNWAAADRNRSYSWSAVTSASDVKDTLNVLDFDVLLVLDQPNAPAGQLSNIGTSWSATLDSFVRAGGAVVVLGSDSGVGEMDDFVDSAGLLAATSQTDVTYSSIHNRAPFDVVGVNVLTPFLALDATCTWATSDAPGSATVFVVTDQPASAGMLGNPVVVHKVATP